MVGAIWYLHKHIEDSSGQSAGLVLIAGGLGNFIDRISQGFVDMFHLDFINFMIFNVLILSGGRSSCVINCDAKRGNEWKLKLKPAGYVR